MQSSRHFIRTNLLNTLWALGLTGVVTFSLMGCSSLTREERIEAKNAGSRASKDTYRSEMIFAGQVESADRPVRHWEFFYKDCEVARRNNVLSRNEWECSER